VSDYSRRDFLKLTGTGLGALALSSLVSFPNIGAEEGINLAANHDVLQSWKDLPVGDANSELINIFEKQGFPRYLDQYPEGSPYNYTFKYGMGTKITGPLSDIQLKLPFTDYVPVEKGPILNPDKQYHFGFTTHGLNHPWLVSLADSAQWEANRHSNLKITILDAQFDEAKMSSQVDRFISSGMDGILMWPRVKAPTGPPVTRAVESDIPVVTMDRRSGSDRVTKEIVGNFPANGTQQAMFLIYKLFKEKGMEEVTKSVESTLEHADEISANIIMNRKPLGSTADAIRTGNFLRVCSHFPNLSILEMGHTPSDRTKAYQNTSSALMSHNDIDVVFNTGGEETMGSLRAVQDAGRMYSAPRSSGDKVLILSNDDSREVVYNIYEGEIDMTAPYTPLLGGLGTRTMINVLAGNQDLPDTLITPDLPMVTQEREDVMNYISLSPQDWWPYCYGQTPEENPFSG